MQQLSEMRCRTMLHVKCLCEDVEILSQSKLTFAEQIQYGLNRFKV